MKISLWATSFLEVCTKLFAFLTDFSPEIFGVPSALPSSRPFPSPVEFWCGEAVGEGERGGPFSLNLVQVFLECAQITS